MLFKVILNLNKIIMILLELQINPLMMVHHKIKKVYRTGLIQIKTNLNLMQINWTNNNNKNNFYRNKKI